jgi:hypothetical protein
MNIVLLSAKHIEYLPCFCLQFCLSIFPFYVYRLVSDCHPAYASFPKRLSSCLCVSCLSSVRDPLICRLDIYPDSTFILLHSNCLSPCLYCICNCISPYLISSLFCYFSFPFFLLTLLCASTVYIAAYLHLSFRLSSVTFPFLSSS